NFACWIEIKSGDGGPARKRAIYGPNEPPPVEPGHRGQLARLIRERPVFVNVGGCRGCRSLKRRNWGEYICFPGVFKGEKAACPDHGNDGTLAIGNLTGRGPKRILGISVRVRTNAGLVSGGAPNT